MSTLATAADGFEAYDSSHVGALLVLVAGAVLLVLLGRRRRADDPDDRLGRVFAVAMLAVTVPLQILYFTPAYWDLDKTLPVQLCDLASLVAVYALWSHRWWAVGLTYFWGLTLTIQAILTPDLATGFPEPIFLLFWAMHIGIVWAAVYLVWGRGERPTWAMFRRAALVTAVWAVGVFCLNLILGSNYGFLNAKPAAASILDYLGPWPVYVVAEIAIIAAVWALITWPWTRSAPDAEGRGW